MSITMKIFPERKLGVIKGRGEVSAEEMIRGDLELYNHPDWRNGFNILCDFTEIDQIHLAQVDISRLIESNKIHNPLFNQSKLAVAAAKDLVFGLARMWDTLADDLTMKRAVFRSVDEAMEWLEG